MRLRGYVPSLLPLSETRFFPGLGRGQRPTFRW